MARAPVGWVVGLGQGISRVGGGSGCGQGIAALLQWNSTD